MSKSIRGPEPSVEQTMPTTYAQIRTSDSDDDLPLRTGEIVGPEQDLSTLKLCALTCSVGGLQVLWSAIFTNGTSYLKALGLPENATALVWIAPPLCGCLLQPYFGSLSDSSNHPWGRRRPFIVAGAIGITIFTLALGWSSILALVLTSPFAQFFEPSDVQKLAVICAVISIWCLSIAIQPLQGGIRTLIVDACPTSQQSKANIWAARFTALGNILGCLAGSVGFESEIARFRYLCGLAILLVNITCAVTCMAVRETPGGTRATAPNSSGIVATARQLSRAYRRTPGSVREVFQTQTVAWLGWFGFLFYSSSYASDKFTAQISIRHGIISQQSMSTGGQLGTLAALSLGVVSFAATNALPLLYRGQEAMAQSLPPPEKSTNSSKCFLFTIKKRSMSVPNTWTLSLIAAAIIMISSIFVSDPLGAIALIASIGPSWAVASWAPFTLIGEALREDQEFDSEKAQADQDYSGSIIGLHNIAMSAPQILAAGICFVVLSVADRLGSPDGIGWVFRLSGVPFLFAAVLAYRLNRAT